MQDIMETNVISVTTQEDQESVARLFSLYDLNVLPVVDTENRMVGIVTVDDAIDVIEEETTEDISKMAAITPSDRPYLKTSVWMLWKSRIPWLLLLMLSATFTGMIITHFEGVLSFSHRPDRRHPHADGYGRQLRQPVVGYGDPQPVAG